MTAENQVVKEVSEVSKVEISEKCGLDINSCQDPIKPNGINHAGGNADDDSGEGDSIDNSYVFVSGTDDDSRSDPSEKVVPKEVSNLTTEAMEDHQDHVDPGETQISNAESLGHSLPESNFIVQNTDAVADGNVESLRKGDKDEVEVVMAGRQEQKDGVVGNVDAGPEQVKDQIELEPSISHTGNRVSHLGSTNSSEQTNGTIASSIDANPEQLELSVQPSETKVSELVVEVNTDSGGSEEAKNLSVAIGDAGTGDMETGESNLQTADGIPQDEDVPMVNSEVNIESGATKESKSASPETDQTDNMIEEEKESNLDASHDLSQGQDSKVAVLEVTTESKGESELVSQDKDSGDNDKGSGKVQVCEEFVVGGDAEPGDSVVLKNSSLDVKDTSDENKELEGNKTEISHELTGAQGSEHVISGTVEDRMSEVESAKINLDEQKDLGMSSEFEGHEYKNVASEASLCQSAELAVENGNSEDLSSLNTNEDLSRNPKSENVIFEPSQSHTEFVVGAIDESVEGQNSQNATLNASESLLKEVVEAENSQVPGAVDIESGSSQPNDEQENKVDLEENAVLNANGNEIPLSEAKNSLNGTDEPFATKKSCGSASNANKDDVNVPQISETAEQNDKPKGCNDGDINSVEVNGVSVSERSLPPTHSMTQEIEINSKPVESDERILSSAGDFGTNDLEVETQACTPSDTEGAEQGVPCPVADTKVHTLESATVLAKGSTGGENISSYPENAEGSGAEPLTNVGSEERVCSSNAEDVHFEMKGSSGNTESATVSADVNLDSHVVDSCNEKPDITKEAELIPEDTKADPVAGQEKGSQVVTNPFHYLIKIPRFDDEKLRERIGHAQLKVEEKTQNRDAVRREIQKKKEILQSYGIEFEAAIAEEREARKLVRKKRIEIDSLQSVINRVKNAISVEDIDARIHNMEHMMQHETLPLKEEKQFIRDIKQLNQLREQLSSNMGSEDEVQQALDQKDQIEDRLKVLKKELEGFKNRVVKAEGVATTARKKYDDENKRLKEFYNQFKAADDIRQVAYKELQSLKKELYDKNDLLRMYRRDAETAGDLAKNGDKEALHRLCVNQVKNVMELYNENDEFRKEYVKWNLRSTVRRFGTLDARSLNPDEVPPVVPSYADERVDRLKFHPAKTSSVLHTPVEQQAEVIPVRGAVDKTVIKREEPVKQKGNMSESVKPTFANGSPSSSAKVMTNDNKEEQKQKREEQNQTKEEQRQTMEEQRRTKEELELARKAEELRKEEETAKWKELRRLEEIAKAKEALERKKRIAEKAQLRAELRAKKEAEQKEKEREKRLRKKEKKKAVEAEVPEGSVNGESTHSSESSAETVKDSEIKEVPQTVTKRPQKPSAYVKQSKSKSIPPPLRNRSRKKMQQWMWVIFTSVIVIALFLLGNVGVFSNLRQRRPGY